MNSILSVWEVTEDGEPTLVFDNRAAAVDYAAAVVSMGLWCLGDTVTVTVTQKEMTWADYNRISLEEL